MSNFCPHCDDFSIDVSRSRKTENREAKEKPKMEGSKPNRGNGNKITINVDSSNGNSDWNVGSIFGNTELSLEL